MHTLSEQSRGLQVRIRNSDLNLTMQNCLCFICFFTLAIGSSELKDTSEDLTHNLNHATVYIEEPADGEVIALSSGEDSIDLVAYADGANITSDCIFIMQLGDRRPMIYRFLAFAADTNRGMLHTRIRDIVSQGERALSIPFKLVMSIAIPDQERNFQTARILAWTSISFRVDRPRDPAAEGDPDPRPSEPLLGIRSGFVWSHSNASSILTGPWPLPCPHLPVRTLTSQTAIRIACSSQRTSVLSSASLQRLTARRAHQSASTRAFHPRRSSTPLLRAAPPRRSSAPPPSPRRRAAPRRQSNVGFPQLRAYLGGGGGAPPRPRPFVVASPIKWFDALQFGCVTCNLLFSYKIK